MAIVKIYIWLPTKTTSPFSKGGYGHVAAVLPAEQGVLPMYLSLSPGGDATNCLRFSYNAAGYTMLSHDKQSYSRRGYAGYCIEVPFSDAQIASIRGYLQPLLGNYRLLNDPHGSNTAYPDIIRDANGVTSGLIHFKYWRNPMSRKTHHNCTSLIVGILEAGGKKLPMKKGFLLFTSLLNIINPFMVGYTIGVLTELCFRCHNQIPTEKVIAGFGIAQAIFYLSSFSAAFLFNFLYSACYPNKYNSNFYMIASLVCFVGNLGCTVTTAVLHARMHHVFDASTEIAAGIGAAVGFLLFIFTQLWSLRYDTLNYIIRPRGLFEVLKRMSSTDTNILVRPIDDSSHAHSDDFASESSPLLA